LELTRLFTIALEITAFVAMVAMTAMFLKSYKLYGFFQGRPGGTLMKLIVGVIFGFTIVQALVVLNVLGLLTGWSLGVSGLHNGIRLLQQLLVLAICAWAWKQMSKLY